MGIEKVIPELEDVSHFLEILARTATGQKLTTYTNFINGPRREAETRRAARSARGHSRQRAQHDARRPGAARGAVLPAMRRVPQRLPDLSAYRRARLQLDLSGSDRIDHQSEPVRQRGGPSAVRVDAMRRVPRYLSGEDRYSAHPAASALEGDCGQGDGRLPVPIWPRAAQRARAGVRNVFPHGEPSAMIRVMGRLAGSWMLRPLSRDGWMRWMPPPFSMDANSRFSVPARTGGANRSAARSKAANRGTRVVCAIFISLSPRASRALENRRRAGAQENHAGRAAAVPG